MTRMLKEVDTQILVQAARHLKHGGLVSFPTETVYGLGADAGNPDAIRSIYAVKGRPATDPLIVHVDDFVRAEDCIDPNRVNTWQRAVMACLAKAFWPGPLTLILPARLSAVAAEVTSGTGWVGLRQPAHSLALQFLKQCQVPVAAPSANLFGHVSPTKAEHVMADFPNVDNLWILDGGRCGFGIESTVVRINSDETLDVLRRGGVSVADLQRSLLDEGLLSQAQLPVVRVIQRHLLSSDMAPQAAPGQLLVHYAPRIETCMVNLLSHEEMNLKRSGRLAVVGEQDLKKTVLLDFAGLLVQFKSCVGHYRDLSPSGDVSEAIYSLFDSLRWAEDCVVGEGSLWIFNPKNIETDEQDLFLSLQDRIYRAAAGRESDICSKPNSDQVFFSAQ